MTEKKQKVQKNRVILIVATLTPSGIRLVTKKFKAVEKDKSYWLDGEQRRVSKENFIKPYSTKTNDLKIKTEIEYKIWCFGGEEKTATVEVITEIIKCFGMSLLAINALQTGISKYLIKLVK